MASLLDYAPIAAACFAVPEFLPQLRKLAVTGDAAGVSWSWGVLTAVNNAAWLVYFALSAYWTALIPSASATTLATALAVMLTRRGQARRRPAIAIGAWAALLAGAFALAGQAPGNAADRRVHPPGRAVHLDRLPDGPPHRHRHRDVAAHGRRAHLLAGLRPAQVRPAADHPRRRRDHLLRADPRPGPPPGRR